MFSSYGLSQQSHIYITRSPPVRPIVRPSTLHNVRPIVNIQGKFASRDRVLKHNTICCIDLEVINPGDKYCICSSKHNDHVMKVDNAIVWFKKKMECPICREPIIACVYTNK